MDEKPITVVETPVFLSMAGAIWTGEERGELIDFVAPGTGGVRKLRWSRAGTGKRGGARVIYFYYQEDSPIYMLLAYAKAASVDMTQDQKRQVTKLTAILKKLHAANGD